MVKIVIHDQQREYLNFLGEFDLRVSFEVFGQTDGWIAQHVRFRESCHPPKLGFPVEANYWEAWQFVNGQVQVPGAPKNWHDNFKTKQKQGAKSGRWEFSADLYWIKSKFFVERKWPQGNAQSMAGLLHQRESKPAIKGQRLLTRIESGEWTEEYHRPIVWHRSGLNIAVKHF